MTIHYRDDDTKPRTYSNGAREVIADFMFVAGVETSCDLRRNDGFYLSSSGFLDAPNFIHAGSMLGETEKATHNFTNRGT